MSVTMTTTVINAKYCLLCFICSSYTCNVQPTEHVLSADVNRNVSSRICAIRESHITIRCSSGRPNHRRSVEFFVSRPKATQDEHCSVQWLVVSAIHITVMLNTHRRRDSTRQLSLVGVGGVYWA